MNDELVILGSGGGRHHIRTQHRATGGILYKFDGIQAHIDPGPGATVRINQYDEDPAKTELIIVTHVHIDHFNDVSAIIEASREIFYDKERNFVRKGTLITTREVLRYVSDYHINMLENVVDFNVVDKYNYKGIELIKMKVEHTPRVDGFGVRFNLKEYSLAFTSDTKVFDGFSQQFSGVNILVLNLLRPNSIACKRHVCTDEVIPYLNKIEPQLDGLIITHFGAYMDSHRSPKNFVPSQVKKLKEMTNIKHVIAAEDGLKIKLAELLQ